jgi:hypothetical protein
MRWFERHRQDWIAETLRVFGFINREHIEKKFGVSTPQASHDLREFQRLNPGAVTYDKSAKRYVPMNGHRVGEYIADYTMPSQAEVHAPNAELDELNANSHAVGQSADDEVKP